MTRKLICCEVMKEEILHITPQGRLDCEFLTMGLHDYPDKLRKELQTIIDNSPGYETVILGFGYCGQAADGLKAIHCRLVMPLIHECIPMLIGSRKIHKEITEENRGTYFLSGGWTEGDKALLSEFRRYCSKFGEEDAADIYKRMFANYSQLMFINTKHPRNRKARDYSRETARLLDLQFREITGSSDYLERLVNGPWEGDDFVMIEKGETVTGKLFR